MYKRKNKFFITALFVITCSVMIFASNNSSKHASLFDGCNKAWRSIGYGYMFTVQADSFFVFDVTKVSSLPVLSGIIKDDTLFTDDITFGTLKMVDDTIKINLGDENNYCFLPCHDIPVVPYTELTNDPVANFEVFWNTFEENCILFKLTNTDWKEMYNHYRPLVNQQTTDSTLFEIFSQMIKSLHDGHCVIIDTKRNNVYTPGPVDSKIWDDKTEDLIRVINQRADNKKLLSAANDMLQYGTIDDTIGYLNILGFSGYLSKNDVADERTVFTSNLDIILDSFKNNKAIILDIRFNGGGMDELAIELAERFVEQKKIGYYKQARIGGYDDLSASKPFYLIPDGTQVIDKPVILLTSRKTASAADVCAMLFKDIPNVTVIGETTYGIFSDILQKSLPNGWLFALSNEKYSSADWKYYEQIGISPDMSISLDTIALALNHDNILERAIDEIRNHGTAVTTKSMNPMSSHFLNVDYSGIGKKGININYRLAGTGRVQLDIYNLSGRKVAAIVDKVQNAGDYHIIPDGFALPKGTYLLQIKTDMYKDVTKFDISR